MEHYIHQGLLSRLSAPLKDLVNKVASTEGYVTWADVDEEIFSRFVQFVYCGTYTGPALIGVDDIEHSEEATSPTANVFENLPNTSSPDRPVGSFSYRNATLEPPQNAEHEAFTLPYSLASFQVRQSGSTRILSSWVQGFRPNASSAR